MTDEEAKAEVDRAVKAINDGHAAGVLEIFAVSVVLRLADGTRDGRFSVAVPDRSEVYLLGAIDLMHHEARQRAARPRKHTEDAGCSPSCPAVSLMAGDVEALWWGRRKRRGAMDP